MRADEIVVLGVDPGSRSTGLVVRQGSHLLAHQVVEVASGQEPPTRRQIQFTIVVARQLLSTIGATPLPFRSFLVAVEDVNEPTPHLGVINLKGLLGTAKVLGAFQAVEWSLIPGTVAEVVTVPPGRNGKNLLRAYPAELVTSAERTKGLLRPAGDSALIRHCRSAWDVAGAAPMRAALAQ